jgi:hypothetical protein
MNLTTTLSQLTHYAGRLPIALRALINYGCFCESRAQRDSHKNNLYFTQLKIAI